MKHRFFIVCVAVTIVALIVIGCRPAGTPPSVPVVPATEVSKLEPIELTRIAPIATPTPEPGDCKDKGLPGLPCVSSCPAGHTPIRIVAVKWTCETQYMLRLLGGDVVHVVKKGGENDVVSCDAPPALSEWSAQVIEYTYAWQNEETGESSTYIAGEAQWQLLSVGLRFCGVYDNGLFIWSQSPNGGEWGAYESLPPTE